MKMKALEKQIAEHPVNPESLAHDADADEKARAHYRALKAELKSLVVNIGQSATT